MAADPSSQASSRKQPEHVLHCGVCGRTVEKTREELLRRASEGWPRCCDQVMGYFTLTTRPDSDTALGGPSLPPG